MPPRLLLECQQDHDEAQQTGRQLGCRCPVAQREPGAVDAGGECLNSEVRHRAVVGQSLHQHQCSARSNRRPSDGNRQPPETLPSGESKRSAGLDQRARSFEEGGACQHEHVRIEDEGEHQHSATQAADVRKAPGTRSGTDDAAQCRLHRTRELKQVGVGISHHISGHRQRKEQSPFEEASPRKVELRDQPSRPDANHRRQCAHPHTQPERRGDVVRQHGGRQMRPGFCRSRCEDVSDHRCDRQGHQEGHQHGGASQETRTTEQAPPVVGRVGSFG